MSVERPDFLTEYNKVVVPEPILSMDSLDEGVNKAETKFLDEIMDSLDVGNLTLDHFFEIDIKMLVPPFQTGVSLEKQRLESDDYIKVFKKRGSQVLASVVYFRDDFNYQITHFAKYPLLSKTEQEIRELQRLERIQHGLE